jgi:hypothetical protein
MLQLVFGMLMATLAVSHAVAAQPMLLPATIVSAFDFRGKVRFCYDQQPEFIYFRNTGNGRSAVEARSMDASIRTIFDFPGLGDDNSLSCSVDGSTVAALNTTQGSLIHIQGIATLGLQIRSRPALFRKGSILAAVAGRVRDQRSR